MIDPEMELNTGLGSLFQIDPDLRLAGTEVYLDPSESRETAVITHGHSDHIGAHGSFVATPPTAAFLRLRIAASCRGTELPYRKPLQIGRYEIELFPAGHVLGSAMISIRADEGALLYTGDLRLRPSRTAEPAEVPRCDFLITESTYGSPFWRFPDRAETEERLCTLLHELIDRELTPVILAYSLGKAQEAMSLLATTGFRCVVHPAVAAISRIYEKFLIDLGAWESWAIQGSLFDRSTRDLKGKVLVMPPHLKRDLRLVPRRKTIALTGWALDPRRSGWSDYSFPISDHADFDELLELIDRARPRVVYTTHGAPAFARELRRRGIPAESLRQRPQMRLF